MVLSTEDKILIKTLRQKKDSLLSFPTKLGLRLARIITHSVPQLSGKEARQRDKGQNVRWAQETTLNQFRNLFSAKKVSRLHIEQCVKSQEKPTEIITVIKYPFFRQNIGNCTISSTVNNSPSFFTVFWLNFAYCCLIIQHYFM